MNKLFIWILPFLLGISPKLSNAKHLTFYQDSLEIAETEAILILPGLGGTSKLRKKQLEYFSDKGFDVFIPDYISRKSVDQCVENLTHFYDDYNLAKYKKVHCFSYILGSWVLNDYISKNGRKNIASIMYDRSPLQERAPAVLVKRIYPIAYLLKGALIKDLSQKPYQEMTNDTIEVGIMIESKATPLIRMFKKTTLNMGEVHWSVDSLHQTHNDYAYTQLHHKQMYHRFDVVGDDILHFFRNGKFGKSAKRVAYEWDPFEPYQE